MKSSFFLSLFLSSFIFFVAPLGWAGLGIHLHPQKEHQIMVKVPWNYWPRSEKIEALRRIKVYMNALAKTRWNQAIPQSDRGDLLSFWQGQLSYRQLFLAEDLAVESQGGETFDFESWLTEMFVEVQDEPRFKDLLGKIENDPEELLRVLDSAQEFGKEFHAELGKRLNSLVRAYENETSKGPSIWDYVPPAFIVFWGLDTSLPVARKFPIFPGGSINAAAIFYPYKLFVFDQLKQQVVTDGALRVDIGTYLWLEGKFGVRAQQGARGTMPFMLGFVWEGHPMNPSNQGMVSLAQLGESRSRTVLSGYSGLLQLGDRKNKQDSAIMAWLKDKTVRHPTLHALTNLADKASERGLYLKWLSNPKVNILLAGLPLGKKWQEIQVSRLFSLLVPQTISENVEIPAEEGEAPSLSDLLQEAMSNGEGDESWWKVAPSPSERNSPILSPNSGSGPSPNNFTGPPTDTERGHEGETLSR